MSKRWAWIVGAVLVVFGCGPVNEAALDATVNARVAATLIAAQGGEGSTATPFAGDPAAGYATAVPENTPQSGGGEAPIGSGPQIGGCQIFPVDHIWNTRVDTLPVHPNSDAYIGSIGGDTGLHPDFGAGEWDGGPIGIPINVVDGSVAPAEISFYYPDESDPGPYPIPADPLIEGGPDADGDRHILIVDTARCRLVEIFDAYPTDRGTWEAGAGAIWDLNGYDLRPDEWTSADAAGLAILPGLVRYDEVLAGEIRHAIRFTAEETREEYIWPARHEASDITDPNVPPMGQRFRLKADFYISGYPHDVQVILRAMQVYGIILADNGSDWFFSGAPDPRWNDEELVDTFREIDGSNFEAVDVSGLMIDPNSGQALQP